MTERNEHQTFKADKIPCQEISDPAVLSKNSLVSVKMITYNHEPYIAQAIQGVLMQETNFPFELIIGEDCSTDGTQEIVLDYQKKYPDIIRIITSDKNVGMKKNSYRAMKACLGKYVAFCEGDDYWHYPMKLQNQVDYMDIHPECGLLFADCDYYHVSTNRLLKNFNYFYRGYQKYENLKAERLLANWALFTLTAVIRRDLYERVVKKDPYLYRSEKFLMGDMQLWTEIGLISKVSYVPESLATYRALDESASNSKDQKNRLRYWKSVYEMKMYLCDKHKLFENVRKEAESAWFDKTLQLSFYERNADLALLVKKKKRKFTWKEWLRFFGAKYLAFHYGIRLAAFLFNRFKKKNIEWP